MTFYCGWDGGGTKTEVLCLDENGNAAAHETFGPLNLNGAAPEKVTQTIEDAVSLMCTLPGGLDACKGLTVGAAGVSNARVSSFLTDRIRAAGYGGKLSIVGDHEIALAGAIRGAGAVLIAGTGAVCCGRNASGGRTRVGGFGHLIDDGGSGYAIGRDILSAVVRAQDGRGEPTCLTELTLKRLGAKDAYGIVTWLYASGTGKKEVAALAPLLQEALSRQDRTALEIAKKAARELAELAVAAWRNLGLNEGELAFTGSVLKYYPAVRDEVCRLCAEACPAMTILPAPRGTAVEGAVRLAMEG